MYQFDDVGHEFAIFAAPPGSSGQAILQAPPIVLDNKFIFRHFKTTAEKLNFADTGLRYGEAQQLTDLAASPQLYLRGDIHLADIPTLICCTTELGLPGVKVDLAPNAIPWKLCLCRLTAKSLMLQFIDMRALRGTRTCKYAELHLQDVSILQMACHIIYSAGKHTNSEHYTCITNPCAPESHMASFRVEYHCSSLIKPDQDSSREISHAEAKVTFEDSYY